ncbi:MAG: Hsp20/alpha crystallin family protein [Candidatus Moraniibacteriota bacterium]
MPDNKKSSFFRRLMGVEREEAPDGYNYYQEQGGEMPAQEPVGQNYPPQNQPYSQENTITPSYSNPPEQATRITPTTPQSGEEEGGWVADQEGQLTIDVYQTDSDIVIKSTIAGVKPEDLDIQINNDMVTIRGERRKEDEVRDEDYYYQECYWGAFSRSIILPVDVEANKAEAIMKNGILSIRLPKAETAKARKIQVRGY